LHRKDYEVEGAIGNLSEGIDGVLELSDFGPVGNESLQPVRVARVVRAGGQTADGSP